MATIQQLDEFNAFAEQLAKSEGGSLTVDEVYDRWWEEKHRDEDLAAIQASVEDYQNGERGESAREELQQFRSERAEGKKG